MKTILVLVGGSKTDSVVFETALAAARPLGAHLEFLHMHVSLGQAAAFTPHVDFAQGAGLRAALGGLVAEADARAADAARHCHRFCEEHAIAIADTLSEGCGVSASWCEERDNGLERMMLRARHRDLVVLGRAPRANGLPPDLIEILLLHSGRPVLVAPPRAAQSVIDTVLLCWNETPAAARATGATLPLLSKSKRVVIIAIEQASDASRDGLRDLVQQLTWHGVSAEPKWIPAGRRSVAEQLESAAAEYRADLIVMGAYGHNRIREKLFDGCTQHFIDHAERPVLFMH